VRGSQYSVSIGRLGQVYHGRPVSVILSQPGAASRALQVLRHTAAARQPTYLCMEVSDAVWSIP